jgi:hypothetical protein
MVPTFPPLIVAQNAWNESCMRIFEYKRQPHATS